MKRFPRAIISIFVMLLAGGSVAHAGLGDKVTDDAPGLQSPMNAKFPTSVNYKIQESNSGSLRIRQYITSDGTVFGIAWRGRATEEQYSTLLSHYNDDYQKFAKVHPKRVGRIPYRKVKMDNVVLEEWDMLRRVRGRAYVPAIVPTGLDPVTTVNN